MSCEVWSVVYVINTVEDEKIAYTFFYRNMQNVQSTIYMYY